MLELLEVRRSYGTVVALDGLSLRVPPGEIFGLLGPNGAGKTTAMQIVMGVRRADAGEVLWEGHPVTTRDRLGFGYMPEERGLYPRMRVREQLVYLARLRGLEAAEALRNADLWLNRLEVTGRASSKVEELSSGNQQRVQLAAALVHDPTLLILDEPFAGLDPISAETLAEVLRDQADRGRGVLFSSHHLDLVEHLCDTVAIVHRGKTALQGRVEDLKRRGPRRLRIAGPDSSIWANVEGVNVLERGDHESVLQLAEKVDEQALLRRALDAGEVVHFGFEAPKLSELFREAVGEKGT
jgi:ABC-2 type transport system ATP-binding protein